jgi:hypothetical protein
MKQARETRQETEWQQEPVKARTNSAREMESVAKKALLAPMAFAVAFEGKQAIALIGRARVILPQRGAISRVKPVTNVGTRSGLCYPRKRHDSSRLYP